MRFRAKLRAPIVPETYFFFASRSSIFLTRRFNCACPRRTRAGMIINANATRQTNPNSKTLTRNMLLDFNSRAALNFADDPQRLIQFLRPRFRRRQFFPRHAEEQPAAGLRVE